MSGMTPRKRSLLRDQLAGIEFRNQQRQARRRSILAASLQRQYEGTARRYDMGTRTSLLNPQPSSIQPLKGREA